MERIIAVDVRLNPEVYHSEGTAYFRLPDDFFNFLKLCQEKHGISGFEYDGSRNFGVILDKPAKP